MTVNLDQADPRRKYSCMDCRACVKLLLDVYGIDATIGTQMI